MSASPALKRPSRRKLAAGVAAVLALSASAASHAASTWYVNDCTDGTNPGQFRWAVNGAVSGDTIDLTTQLTPAGYPNCANAVLNGFNHTLTVSSTVTLAGGVTIQGPGKTELALSAAGLNARVIQGNGDLTINDLGVKYGGGNSPSTGACIRANNNITLTNVKAFHCYAYSNAGTSRGGAVYSFLGSVTMNGSTVDKSEASSVSGSVRGGAVYGFTGVSLTSTSITNSTATTQTGSAEGGAVFNFGSGGGGLALSSSSISGTASVTNTGGGHAYGGAAESRTTTTVDNFTFVQNSSATTQSGAAARGGAIYSIGNVVVNNSSNVWSSSAYSKSGAAHGGGIYTKGNALIEYSSIQVNGAERGGGVYSNAGLIMKYSMVYGNNASIGGGGAINRTAGNSLVRGSVIWNNGSNDGFAGLDLFAGGGTTITIENSTITGNQAASGFGALYLKSYHTTLDNSTVAYNSSGSGPAVGVYAGNAGSTFDMHSTLLASNASGASFNDLDTAIGFTGSSSNNFVRSPGSGVPGDTIVGQCPQLRKMKQDFSFGSSWWNRWVLRPTITSPAVDVGSNPHGFDTDQRGGGIAATSPPRASGPGPANASPIPDIGAYEINQDDVIFDSEFDGCP